MTALTGFEGSASSNDEVTAGLEPLASGRRSPLRAGTRVARWTIAKVHPVQDGALSMLVTGQDGQSFTLEVMARDANPLAPSPPAMTDDLAIYVHNGGNGWMPTSEEQGLAAMTLAHFLEAQGHGGRIRGLLSQSERLHEHPRLTTDGSLEDPTTARAVTASLAAPEPARRIDASPSIAALGA